MSNKSNWYCFIFDRKKVRGLGSLEEFLRKTAEEIFGEDFYDICVIGDKITDETFETHAESYFFVRCSNYQNHSQDVKRSSVVTLVLPSTDNPDKVSDADINLFRNTSNEKFRNDKKFMSGDIIRVKEGYLQNLTGIVLEENKDGSYAVFFRLYTRQFVEKIKSKNIVFVGRLYDYSSQRSPVPTGCDIDLVDDAAKNSVKGLIKSESSVRRKKHRRNTAQVPAPCS